MAISDTSVMGSATALPTDDVTDFHSWLERGHAQLSPDGRILFIDRGLCDWMGRGAAELTGKEFAQALAELCPDSKESVSNLLSGSGPFNEVALRYEVLGTFRWVRIESSRHDSGFSIRVQSILPPEMELSKAGWTEALTGPFERGEMFLRLLKAEGQLQNLAQRWPGVVFTQRPDFSFHYVSPQIEKLTGIPEKQWSQSSRTFWQAIHEADVEDLQQHLRRASQSNESVTTTFRVRHAQTGKISYILEHRQPIRSAGGLVLSHEGIWLDITRQTIAEKRLSAAAWKETLAMLTMGLAHDFNNVLAGISALSESFLAQAEPDHPFAEGLKMIHQNSIHASQLVHRIMSLHRSKTGENSYHNLNDVLTEFSDLVEKILPRRIKTTRQLSPDSTPIYADVVELRQVVLNFALNAADAMPDRGQLTFTVSRHQSWEAPKHFVGIVPRLPCVCLEIKDTGCGIPERHLGLLFDPFFTTKPVNKGSGLGLFNARLCVEKHQGGISVDSVVGQGTTFRVWLPEADFTEAERAQELKGPRRSLLLFGEAGLLLDSTAEFLRASGYYVVKSSQAEQARDFLLSEDSSFAAFMVLADPRDQSLPQYLREVRKSHPHLKIILQIVGGTADELASEVMSCGDLTITNGMSESVILKHLESLLRDARST